MAPVRRHRTLPCIAPPTRCSTSRGCSTTPWPCVFWAPNTRPNWKPTPDGRHRLRCREHWKRAQFDQAGIPVPDALVFAPVDFETQTIAGGLPQAGFDPGKATFISWLGVTPYLTKLAITDTLKFALALPRGSAIVFDYMVDPTLLSPPARHAFDRLAQWVAATGEPFVSWFKPSSLENLLLQTGFRQVTDLGPETMNARYFQNRDDGLRVGSLTHVMNAQV